jgi:hypothetical protein
MATITINATLQGVIERQDSSGSAINWVSTTRNAAAGTGATTITANTFFTGMKVQYTFAKNLYVATCNRTFLFFDLSSVGGTITAATLRVLAGTPGNTDDVQAVPSTAWGGDGTTTTLATGDYDGVEFNGTSGSNYGLRTLNWIASNYNDITLTADAISDMNSDGYLNCALLNSDNDYKGVAPTLGTLIEYPIEFLAANDPIRLDITYTPAGWNDNVNGVANASIANVMGVTESSIAGINGT